MKQKKTKLALSTHTVRSLQSAESLTKEQLKQVGGGLYTIILSVCAQSGGCTG